jgi:translation elongation factor EF-G
VGLAFKLEEGKYGQLTYMRVYSGKVSKGASMLLVLCCAVMVQSGVYELQGSHWTRCRQHAHVMRSKAQCLTLLVDPVLVLSVSPPPPAPAGDFITNSTNGKRMRVPRLVRIHSDELEDIPSAVSGSGALEHNTADAV